MAVIRTVSDLGWGATITAPQIGSAYDLMAQDDVLEFELLHNLSGQVVLSGTKDVTFRGVSGGGWNRTDVGVTKSHPVTFTGSGRPTLADMTMTASAGFNFDGGTLIRMLNTSSGFTMTRCYLRGDLASMLEVNGSNYEIITYNHFDNTLGKAEGRVPSAYQQSMINYIGDCRDGEIGWNWFESPPHECIKSGKTNSTTARWETYDIHDNWVTDVGREFTDTTGGCRGRSVSERFHMRNNTLINCGAIADIKATLKDLADYPINNQNAKHISITGNKLYNSGVGQMAIITFDDRRHSVTDSGSIYYWRPGMPEDIIFDGNMLQNVQRTILVKMGYGVVVSNTVKRGTVGPALVQGASALVGGPVTQEVYDAYAAGGTIYTETGSSVASAETVPSKTPPFSVGPGASAPTGTAPAITSAAIIPDAGLGPTFPVGTNFTVAFEATGSPTPTLQSVVWQMDEPTTDTTVSTATTYTADTPTTTLDATITVSNGVGSPATATTAKITITAAGALPSITGDTLTLLATAPT